MKKILFICTHNSARSQIAEGYMKVHYCDSYKAYSAGTEPSSVNPYALKVMKEIGIDISNQKSKSVNEFIGKNFDYIVTVCDSAKVECPFFPGGKQYIHQSFDDPAEIKGTDEEKLSAFRRVRDEIINWINKTFKN